MNYFELGKKNIWLPYTPMLNHLPQLEAIKTKGTKIYLKNGQRLIDGIASWWAVCHGYNHPYVIKKINEQLKIMPHLMLAGFANEATYKLAYRLANFCEMDKVFFSDSGSTAVEVAMKIAWQYYINSGYNSKKKFISFKNSYHGDTTGAMSLADLNSGMHQKFSGNLLENFCLKLPKQDDDFIEFENFIAKNHPQIAGIFIEPLVQCAGGMKFHNIATLDRIFAIAKKHKIITICDECATGFYRTGKKFAFLHTKFKPDILLVGKALSAGYMGLSATLTSNEIFDKFNHEDLNKALMHGPTFMGNALACASANASLDLFENIDYEKKVKIISDFFAKNLPKFKKFKKVIEVRYIGAIAVIEIDTNWEEIKKMRLSFIEKNVFLRPFGNVIYVMPSFNISIAELKNIFSAIEKVLKEIN